MAPAQSQTGDETEAPPATTENMDKVSTPSKPNPTPAKTLKFATQSCEKNAATGVCFVTDASLNELSGIAAHSKLNNVFWVHNDEGPGIIYALNHKGEILVRLTLPGITFLDSEDITSGPGPKADSTYLYMGDIGSKGKTAGRVTVFRMAEPTVDPNLKAVNVNVSDAITINLSYPGNALLDFETMFLDPIDGHLFLVQKGGYNVFKAEKSLLNAAISGGTVAMTLVRSTGAWTNEPSAGNMSPGGDEIILRNETTAWLFRRAPGQKVEDALGTIAATIPLGPEFNGEAISFDNKGVDFYTVSENQSKAADTPSPPQPVSIYKRLP